MSHTARFLQENADIAQLLARAALGYRVPRSSDAVKLGVSELRQEIFG